MLVISVHPGLMATMGTCYNGVTNRPIAMLEKYLQDLGLSEKEAAIYLALLQVDNASVIDLSKKTGVNRSTTYVILDSLAKKGLVSETTIGKKTHYQAEPPERLETYVEKRKSEFDEQAKRLTDLIPQLKGIQRESGERPLVKYFEGIEGMKTSSEELFYNDMDEGGVIHMVYPKDALEEIFTEKEREKLRSMRTGKKIRSKVVYTSSSGARPSDQTGDRIQIDEKRFPISCDISVYKDRVRISILGKRLSSIFIHSSDVAETMRSLINLAFENQERNK